MLYLMKISWSEWCEFWRSLFPDTCIEVEDDEVQWYAVRVLGCRRQHEDKDRWAAIANSSNWEKKKLVSWVTGVAPEKEQ
jgi:hypothetical protein